MLQAFANQVGIDAPNHSKNIPDDLLVKLQGLQFGDNLYLQQDMGSQHREESESNFALKP